jgi:hypothetical protein
MQYSNSITQTPPKTLPQHWVSPMHGTFLMHPFLKIILFRQRSQVGGLKMAVPQTFIIVCFHKLRSYAMPEFVQFLHLILCKYFTQYVLQRNESTSQTDKHALLSLLCKILLIGSKNHMEGRLDRTRCDKTSRKNNLIFKKRQIKISKGLQMWRIIKHKRSNEIKVMSLENM